MLKKVFLVLLALSLISIAACSTAATSTTTSSQPSSVKTIRESKIGDQWTMKQMEISVGIDASLVVKLADGDKVDGYFYLEKGAGIDFQVAGTSVIYQSQPAGAKAAAVTSDRFSFTASAGQGIAYTLMFTNADAATKIETVFLEIIYPVTGSLYVPIGTK